MRDEILLQCREDGTWEEYKEPYATIDCATEEDYLFLQEAVKHYQKEKEGCEICNEPPKWFAVFGAGFPYLHVRKVLFKDGRAKAKACPFCGRELKEN